MMILKVALRDLRRMLKDKCDEIFADEELSRAFYQKIAEIEEDERFVLVEYMGVFPDATRKDDGNE